MSEEDNVVSPDGFDLTWTRNRAEANSPEMEAERLRKELGFEDPPAPIPLPPEINREPQGASDAVDAVKNAASAVGGVIGGAAELGAGAMSAGVKAIKNPGQALGGVADLLANVNNFGLKTYHAFDGLVRRGEWNWAALRADEKVDYGSLVAPPPVTDDEKTARQAGKFVGQMALFVAGGEVAAAGTAAGTLAQTGAKLAGAGVTNMMAFDPHEEGLSDLLQRNPSLRNAVTEYFSVKDTDTEAVGDFKNFLAGALGEGIGIAAFNAFSMYKNRRALTQVELPRSDFPVTNSSLTPNPRQMENARAMGESRIEIPSGEKVPPQPIAASVDSAAPLADDATLRAAETNAGAAPGTPGGPPPGAGAEAPPVDIPKGRGPVVARSIEKELRTPFRVGEEERLSSFVKEVNVNKMKFFGMGETMAEVDPRLFKGTPQTWDKSIEKAGKLVVNPEEVKRLRRITLNDPNVSQDDIFALGMLRDYNFVERERMVKMISTLADDPNTTEETLHAAVAEMVFREDEAKVWGGILENRGSKSGQALNAVKGANATPGASKYSSLIANEDITRAARGDLKSAVAAAKQEAEIMAASASDPKFVGWYDRVKANISKLLNGNKFTDLMRTMHVNFKLANPITQVINPVSQVVQIANRVDGEVWTNRASRWAKEKKITITDDDWKRLFKTDSVDKIPMEMREAYRKFLDWRATNAEAGKLIEAQALIGMKLGLKKDLLNLHGLARDGKFISGTQAKFGTVTRTHTIEELSNMDPDHKLGLLLSQLIPSEKTIVNEAGESVVVGTSRLDRLGSAIKAPSQMMATSDALMGAVASRTSHNALAMRYAVANAGDNPLMIEKLYKEAMSDPPPWMTQMVIDDMNRANFTTEITKQTNPLLVRAKNLVNSNGITRHLVPFTTVVINGISQAIDHTPILANLISPRFKANLAAGGLVRDQALGRVMLGTEVMGIGGLLFAGGYVTGKLPRDPDSRQAFLNANPGFKEDALKVGDTYIALRALEGPGRVLKYGAQLAQLLPYMDSDNSVKEWQDLLLAGAALAGEQMSPDFLIQENGKVINAIMDPTGAEGKRWIAQKLSSPFIHEGGRFVRNVVDPERRKIDADNTDGGSDVFEMAINNFKNAYPFLSTELVPYRNLWGETVEYALPLTGPENTSPIAYTKSKDRVVEDKIVALGMSNPFFKDDRPEGDKFLTIQMPRKTITLDGATVALSPKEYDDYVRLCAGDYMPLAEKKLISKEKALELTKRNLRQELRDLITSPGFDKKPEPYQKEDIKEIIKEFRKDAKEYMFDLHPDLELRHTVELMDQEKARLDDEDPEREVIERQKTVLRGSRGIGL